MLAEEIHDAPAVLALLDVLHGEIGYFRASQAAPDEQGEDGAVPCADDLLFVRHAKQSLGLLERKPVAGALAEGLGAARAIGGEPLSLRMSRGCR